jgi:hypothetical protein
MYAGEGQLLLRQWLDDIWDRASFVRILEGGEDGPPVDRRKLLAAIEDREQLERLRELTTIGAFAGNTCRCPGDLTVSLYNVDNELLGSATIHSERVSWDRRRFENDLIPVGQVRLQLLFSEFGINGTSRALLPRMIRVLSLDEGRVQFRPANDEEELARYRVPRLLSEALLPLSGKDAGNIDQSAVVVMAERLKRTSGDLAPIVRVLLAWLGTATWPAEAIDGDGRLARRLLDEFEPAAVVRTMPDLVEPSEIMGGLVWAAFRADDASAMSGLGPAIDRLVSTSRKPH